MSRSEPEPCGGGFSCKIQFCVPGYFYEDVMERVVRPLVVVHTWLIHQWLGGMFSEAVKPQTMQNSTPKGTSAGGLVNAALHKSLCFLQLCQTVFAGCG